jgi:flagellar operon protein (TIGR03826 family)
VLVTVIIERGKIEMELKVANCPKCGRVYVKNIMNDICQFCVKEADLQCEACIKYLRSNRGINMDELSEATGVAQSLIAKFIRDGRISIIGNPKMAYGCEVCGEQIRDKTLCGNCRTKLAKDLSNTREDEQRALNLEKQEKRDSSGAAYKISDRLKERP